MCVRAEGEPMRYKITRIESIAQTWVAVTGTNNLGTVTVHVPSSDAANYYVDGHFWIRTDAEGA